MTEFLTKERELELGEKIQRYVKIKENYNAGEATPEEKKIALEGISAIEELVNNNVKLVYFYANKYKKKYPSAGEIEDLIQDGMLGMMKAIYRYDPSRGNKFSTVATMWIQQNIGRTAHETSRLVRLPENRVMEYLKMRDIEKTVLENEGTLSEADYIIKKEIGLSSEKISEIRAAAATHASMNKVVGSGDSGREFGEFFEDEKGEFADNVLRAQMFSIVDDLLAEMEEIEQVVLASSFSLNIPGIEPMSVKEAKEKYKLSNNHFNKTLNGAIEKLKTSMETLGLNFEDFLV